MNSLYISTQGGYLSLKKETIILTKDGQTLTTAQLPLLENILIFGNTQVTTQTIKACLKKRIPIAYLSRSGRCYGRLQPLEKTRPHLIQRQHQQSEHNRFRCAQQLIRAKLHNSRTLLMRQKRRLKNEQLTNHIQQLAILKDNIDTALSIEQLMGIEGAAAATYFQGLNHCISNPNFTFKKRSRRPPTDPVNALLSFGYQLLWNHLLAIIELWGLDPYAGCLHQNNNNHAVLASDFIEQFRAPIIDALVLYLINRNTLQKDTDFDYPPDACYLNASGRKIMLSAFLKRMEELLTVTASQQPRWLLISQQVKAYIQYLQNPEIDYVPYLIQ